MPPAIDYDIPLAIHVTKVTNIVYMVTRSAQVYLFDMFSAKLIYHERVASDSVCVTCNHADTDGILNLTNCHGQLVHVCVDETLVISHITNTLRDIELALDMSRRMNMSGGTHVYMSKLNALLSEGDVAGAVQFAINSPNGVLRPPETIQQFVQSPKIYGQPQPVFQYFAALLDHGKLSHFETIELVSCTLKKRKNSTIKNWISANKLEFSEELGDLLLEADLELALHVYLRAMTADKVVDCFLKLGDVDRLLTHMSTSHLHCNWAEKLKQYVRIYPVETTKLSLHLVKKEWGECIDSQTCHEIILAARASGHYVEIPSYVDDSDPFAGISCTSSSSNATPSSVFVTSSYTPTQTA